MFKGFKVPPATGGTDSGIRVEFSVVDKVCKTKSSGSESSKVGSSCVDSRSIPEVDTGGVGTTDNGFDSFLSG